MAVPLSASIGITQTFITATDKEGGRMWMRQNMQFQNMRASVGVKVIQRLPQLFFHSFSHTTVG